MPIYEFYCPDCNTIYNFLSRSVSDKVPPCPKCKTGNMNRKISLFAVTGKARERGESDEGMPDLPIDENKMEQAMNSLAAEAENLNEDNPRDAAQLMRKLSSMTGLEYGDTMEQALARMEAGEDPEKIEEDMGDMMNTDNPDELFLLPGKKGKKTGKKQQPNKDDTLYEM